MCHQLLCQSFNIQETVWLKNVVEAETNQNNLKQVERLKITEAKETDVGFTT